MGTYTTNYNLFMPSVGETGWGTLVNGNFTTIDTTMKSLNNRITAVENEVNGNLSCTSVTTSGKLTGNGGIAGTTGTFSGLVVSNNIGATGIMPFTILLYGSSTSYYTNFGEPVVATHLNAGSYTGFALFNRVGGSMTANTTYTVYGYPYLLYPNVGGVYLLKDWQIKGGSWSIGIYTSIQCNATISNKNITISNITYTPKTISASDIVKLINGGYTTITITPSENVGTNGCTISIKFTNTSNTVQSVRSVPSGWA